jgi:hypothetical protein
MPPVPLAELTEARPASTAPRDHSFASPSLAVHLRRGAVGFVAVAMAWFLWPHGGALALASAAIGVVALRGCPTCWTIGLVQTLSRRRFERRCAAGGCRLVDARPHAREGLGTVRS